jgi:hypothetical protein
MSDQVSKRRVVSLFTGLEVWIWGLTARLWFIKILLLIKFIDREYTTQILLKKNNFETVFSE